MKPIIIGLLVITLVLLSGCDCKSAPESRCKNEVSYSSFTHFSKMIEIQLCAETTLVLRKLLAGKYIDLNEPVPDIPYGMFKLNGKKYYLSSDDIWIETEKGRRYWPHEGFKRLAKMLLKSERINDVEIRRCLEE